MKKETKKKLEKVIKLITEAASLLEEAHDEEQDAWDSHSETWQESDKGEAAQEDIYTMDSIQTDLEDAIENLDELRGNHD